MAKAKDDRIDFAEFEAILNVTWRDRLKYLGDYFRWGLNGVSSGMSVATIVVVIISLTTVAAVSTAVAPAVIAALAVGFGAFTVALGAYSVYKMNKKNRARINKILAGRIELQQVLIDSIEHQRWQEGLEDVLTSVAGDTFDEKMKNILGVKKIGPIDQSDLTQFYDPRVLGAEISEAEYGLRQQQFFVKYQNYRQVYQEFQEQKQSKIDRIHYTVRQMLQSYDKAIVREAYQFPYPVAGGLHEQKRMGDAICANLIIILRDVPGHTYMDKLRYVLGENYDGLMPQIERFSRDFPQLVEELGGVSPFKRRQDLLGLGINQKLEERIDDDKPIQVGQYVLTAAAGLSTGFGVVVGIGLLVLGVTALAATPVGWAIFGAAAATGLILAVAMVGYKIYQDKQERKLDRKLDTSMAQLSNIGEKSKNAITLDQERQKIIEKNKALDGLRDDMKLVTDTILDMKSNQWVEQKESSKGQEVPMQNVVTQRKRGKREFRKDKRGKSLPIPKQNDDFQNLQGKRSTST